MSVHRRSSSQCSGLLSVGSLLCGDPAFCSSLGPAYSLKSRGTSRPTIFLYAYTVYEKGSTDTCIFLKRPVLECRVRICRRVVCLAVCLRVQTSISSFFFGDAHALVPVCSRWRKEEFLFYSQVLKPGTNKERPSNRLPQLAVHKHGTSHSFSSSLEYLALSLLLFEGRLSFLRTSVNADGSRNASRCPAIPTRLIVDRQLRRADRSMRWGGARRRIEQGRQTAR